MRLREPRQASGRWGCGELGGGAKPALAPQNPEAGDQGRQGQVHAAVLEARAGDGAFPFAQDKCCQSRIWVSKGPRTLALWGRGDRNHIAQRRLIRAVKTDRFDPKSSAFVTPPYRVSGVGSSRFISPQTGNPSGDVHGRAARPWSPAARPCPSSTAGGPGSWRHGASAVAQHMGRGRLPSSEKLRFDFICFKDIFLSILFTI